MRKIKKNELQNGIIPMASKDTKKINISAMEKRRNLIHSIIVDLDKIDRELKEWETIEIIIDLREGMYSLVQDKHKS